MGYAVAAGGVIFGLHGAKVHRVASRRVVVTRKSAILMLAGQNETRSGIAST